MIVRHFKDENVVINEHGVFSEHVLTLFEKEFPQGRDGLVKEITEASSQKIIFAPNYGLSKADRINSYLTNGVDIDSILYDYLNEHSSKFASFKIFKTQLPHNTHQKENHKQIDFTVECVDRF